MNGFLHLLSFAIALTFLWGQASAQEPKLYVPRHRVGQPDGTTPGTTLPTLSIAQITQYPASLRTSLVRMIVGGVQAEDILFNRAADCFGPITATCKGYPTKRFLFHPLGGGASYATTDPRLLASGHDGEWIFASGWSIENAGTQKNDIIAFLPGLRRETCLAFNSEFGISASGSTDFDIDQIPGPFTNGTIPQRHHGMTTANPGIMGNLGALTGAFRGRPYGCFDASDGNRKAGDGPYVFYHVLVER